MDKLCLTIALERYDRHLPFFMGTVTPPAGIEEVAVGTTPGRRDDVDRHGRMFRDRAFDTCEQSLASYIMAKGRGLPFTATPVFPRWLFSQNHMFINVDAGIERPIDLIGKRVGVWSFQNTLCVFYPITHVLMFPQELVTQEPRLPKAMIDVWKKAKRKADTYYGDPGVLQLAFGRNEYETQRDLMGDDLFLSGIVANRKYRERFIDDMADQQLIERSVPVEQLFHESVRDA